MDRDLYDAGVIVVMISLLVALNTIILAFMPHAHGYGGAVPFLVISTDAFCIGVAFILASLARPRD